MKSNRKTMLAAALVVAVVALAGAGYAAAIGYKATTQTTPENTVAPSNYIVLTANKEAYTAVNVKYGFDTASTYDSGAEKFMVTFGNFYDLTETSPSASSAYDKVIDMTGASPAITGYDAENPPAAATNVYKAIAAQTITATVDFANAVGAKASLTATITGSPTTGTIQVIIVKEVSDGSTTTLSVVSAASDVTSNLSNVTPGTTNKVTYYVYLAVPTWAVENVGLNSASWTGTFGFVAEVTSAATA